MNTQTARQERLEVGRAWDRAFGRSLSRALADALVDVMSQIERPTIRDLLRFVGEGKYDVDCPGCVDVLLGDLVGRSSEGPTVAAVVQALDTLGVADLDLVLERPLASLID